MFHNVVQVIPVEDYTVYVYFEDGNRDPLADVDERVFYVFWKVVGTFIFKKYRNQ